MKKSFENRVERELLVDTKLYRYCIIDGVILRIPRDMLGTVNALSRESWEVVRGRRNDG